MVKNQASSQAQPSKESSQDAEKRKLAAEKKKRDDATAEKDQREKEEKESLSKKEASRLKKAIEETQAERLGAAKFLAWLHKRKDAFGSVGGGQVNSAAHAQHMLDEYSASMGAKAGKEAELIGQ